jgi:hypothetical protein
MASVYSTATALAFLIACNHAGTDNTVDPGDTTPEAGDVSDSGNGGTPGAVPDPGAPGTPGTPAAACPLGKNGFTVALGLAAADQPTDLAIDGAGNVLVATKGGDGRLDGFTKLSSSGDILMTRPFGSVVATDAQGSIYLAGSFSQPTDFGSGVIVPEGNVDSFIVKINGEGNVVFAKALGLCGDGVLSLAVDASGKIAVSGSALGTAILDASGNVVTVIAVAGDVAFNSQGDLVIAGTFTSTIDLGDGPVTPGAAVSEGFIAVFDTAGTRLWSKILTGAGVHITSVAVDSKDDIVVVGYYEATIDLFGVPFRAQFAEPGRVTGAFIAKLDASGELVWDKGDAAGVELNGVAVDSSDNVYFAGATSGNQGFARIPLTSVASPVGVIGFGQGIDGGSGYGRGESVVVDSCGSVYTTFNMLDTVNPTSPLRAYLFKSKL